ncbi:MAG: Ldh family oxidoreductase [Actinomycetota bacterium]
MSTHVIVDHRDLRSRVAELFVQAGVDESAALGIAEILVESDLRGIESHGVNFAPRYLRGLQRGLINPRPRLTFVREHGAVAVLDADNGLGFVSARFAMDRAMTLASRQGIGAVAVRNSNHFGMAAFYAMQCLDAMMIGHATTDGPPHTVLWGGREPLVCNNPIAWAFPSPEPPPIVVDTALTGVKEKIRLAAARGEPIPAGWAVGPHGEPTTDPDVALQGALLPIGGHKGSSLIVANELLCGAMAGARFSCEISPALVMGADHHDQWACGHFLMAVDVAVFEDTARYLQRVADFRSRVRASAPARGVDRILLPGELEWTTAEERRANGLPVARATLQALDDVAGELGTGAGFAEMTYAAG